LAGKSKGFALGSGDPKKAKMAILLETPASLEVSYLAKELWDGPDEISRRMARFPELGDGRFVRIGAPVVGPSGFELFGWALKGLGLQRSDLFIENVLHCWPPKGKTDSHYPTGVERKKAEGCCLTMWNRLDEFAPTAAVVNFHPAALLREITPLPLQIRAFERAKKLMEAGERVVVCCGGKAAEAWFGYASNVTKWCGHQQLESDFTRSRRAARWAKGRSLMVEKVRKPRKMTAKMALHFLLSQGKPFGVVRTGVVVEPGATFNFSETGVRIDFSLDQKTFDGWMALCAPKPKVSPCDISQPEETPVASDSQR